MEEQSERTSVSSPKKHNRRDRHESRGSKRDRDDHDHERTHRNREDKDKTRSGGMPSDERVSRNHRRSRSPGRHRHKRKNRRRSREREPHSDEGSQSSGEPRHRGKRDRREDRMKSKFQLKSERLKVLSSAPTSTSSDRVPPNVTSATATKLVEEINKRKLIFSKKPSEPSSSSAQSLWEGTKFTDDPDGNMQAKFKRLMGIKSNEASDSAPAPSDPDRGTLAPNVKAQRYLADLEKQYEVARVATHTQRGLGLGFSTRPDHYPP